MTEAKFINGLKKGDELVYKALFSTYYDWLCNYVYKLSNNYELSEDLVQDFIVKLWENRDSIIIKSSVKNYLFKGCHNQYLQHLRKQKVKLHPLDTERLHIIYSSYEIETDIVLEKRLVTLNELINKLPPRCKEIFILAKLDNKKYKEIAEDLNISIKTVENQMSKALKFFKEHAATTILYYCLFF